jgi:predicted  nucleic acid-binding Zn-ribbon protein
MAGMRKKLDKREYDQLDSPSSSANMEISRLSVVIKNLKECIESLERNRTELMDKLNALGKKRYDRDWFVLSEMR